MSKLSYSQIGWLYTSRDSLAGERDPEKLARKASRIIKARPTWVKAETLAKFEAFVERQIERRAR